MYGQTSKIGSGMKDLGDLRRRWTVGDSNWMFLVHLSGLRWFLMELFCMPLVRFCYSQRWQPATNDLIWQVGGRAVGARPVGGLWKSVCPLACVWSVAAVRLALLKRASSAVASISFNCSARRMTAHGTHSTCCFGLCDMSRLVHVAR